jgi:very-short-patch-repair endonuclease
LPFDFCIPEFKIILELDGPQHFYQIQNWRSPEDESINDVYKTKCANENGYSVIRILQEDVWNDSNEWLNEIIKNIKYIIADNTVIHNIFIDNSDKYDNLMELL